MGFPEPYLVTVFLWGDGIIVGAYPMTTKIIKPTEERIRDRIAREQFDAFEDQERQIKEEERAARAAQLDLPAQISIRLRGYKNRLKNGRC